MQIVKRDQGSDSYAELLNCMDNVRKVIHLILIGWHEAHRPYGLKGRRASQVVCAHLSQRREELQTG